MAAHSGVAAFSTASITGAFGVGGACSLAGVCSVGGTLGVGGSFFLDGAADLGGGLTVQGGADVQTGALNVADGALTVPRGYLTTYSVTVLKAFGAVGDGLADDTAAVQAALDYAAANNVVLLGTAGTYCVHAQLLVGSNTQLAMEPGCLLRKCFAGNPLLTGPSGLNAKISNVAIAGGQLGSRDAAATGRLVALWCDGLSVSDLSVPQYTGPGHVLFVGGDNVRVARVRARNPLGATPPGGIRLFGGARFLCVGCDVDSGDDTYDFNPAAAVFAFGNLSISQGEFVACVGTSTSARLCLAVLADSGEGGMTNSISGVAFVGVRGTARNFGIGVENQSSTGAVRDVSLRAVYVDMTGSTSANPGIRVLATQGSVSRVTLDDVQVLGAAHQTVLVQQDGTGTVSDVYLTRVVGTAPTAGASTALTVAGASGVYLTQCDLSALASHCVSFGKDANNVTPTDVVVRECVLRNIPAGSYGINMGAVTNALVSACRFAPAAGSADSRGVNLTASATFVTVRDNDLAALTGTPQGSLVLWTNGVNNSESLNRGVTFGFVSVTAADPLPWGDRRMLWKVNAGVAQIATIAAPPNTSYQNPRLTLWIAAAITFTNGTGNLVLAGALDFAAANNDVLELVWNNLTSRWLEVGRSHNS